MPVNYGGIADVLFEHHLQRFLIVWQGFHVTSFEYSSQESLDMDAKLNMHMFFPI